MNSKSGFEDRVSKLIEDSIVTKQNLLRDTETITKIAKASEILVEVLRQGNKLLLFGNLVHYRHWE